MSEIQSTRDWFHQTRQIPLDSLPSVRQSAFYLGMQMEELAEKLALIVDANPDEGTQLNTLVNTINLYADMFKNKTMDGRVEEALKTLAIHWLDADADLLWVTIGSGAAQGADLYGAYNHGVAAANWSKKWPDGTFHLDAVTGKVIKPVTWSAADLTPYVHPTLRTPA